MRILTPCFSSFYRFCGICALFLIFFFIQTNTINADVCKISVPPAANLYATARNSVEVIAWKFQVDETCTVESVGIHISHESGRTDDAVLKLYSDNLGNPGTILESVNMGDTVVYPPQWATTTFAGTTVLNSATNYWMGITAQTLTDSLYFYGSETSVSAEANSIRFLNDGTWFDGVGSVNYYELAYEIDGIIGGGSSGTTVLATSTEEIVAFWNTLYFELALTFLLSLIGTLFIWSVLT